VARNASPFFFNSNAILFGGAVIGAFLQFSEQSDLSLVGGGVETADPLLPYLARACPATPAFQIREGSRAEIRDVLFEVLALGVGAFHVNSDAYLDLRANIVAGVGDVPGIGVHCENAGKAMIAAAVTFTTGSTNTRVGNGASGNGDGTFAALLPTAPLYDDSLANGRGGGGVQPGSRAAIWEA
jgi:rhodanese-related sulfurtransferase